MHEDWVQSLILEEDKSTQNIRQIDAYVAQNGLTPTKTPQGLYYVIRNPNPSGRMPKVGETVTVNFSMYRLSGTPIDSMRTNNMSVLGSGYLLAGMEQALLLMHEGEKATLLLPYSLAFGQTGFTDAAGGEVLPAYSPIRVELELLRTRTETEQLDDFFTAKGLKPTATATGLRYVTLTPGTGDAIGRNKTVKVNYRGTFLNGRQFDKSTFDFVTGNGGTIAGFDEAVQLMRVGEKALVALPAALGYGERGTTGIPPKTPLAFEIEVVSAR